MLRLSMPRRSNDRPKKWTAWVRLYWEVLEEHIGASGNSGQQRRTYEDVTIFVDPLAFEGDCDFIVADAAPANPPDHMPNFRLRAVWCRHKPAEVVARTVQLVERMRADPIHQMIHRTRA